MKTLRQWEQRKRKPTGPALVLLCLVERDPGLVTKIGAAIAKTEPDLQNDLTS